MQIQLTCDVPIHIYTLPWAPKHDWSRYMAGGGEILEYIRDVNRKFELDRCIKFGCSVKDAIWNETPGKWRLSGLSNRCSLGSSLLLIRYTQWKHVMESLQTSATY